VVQPYSGQALVQCRCIFDADKTSTYNLKLDGFVVEVNGFNLLLICGKWFINAPAGVVQQSFRNVSTYKVDTNGRNVVLGISLIRELQQDTRLPDTAITNDEQLEKAVVLLQSHCR